MMMRKFALVAGLAALTACGNTGGGDTRAALMAGLSGLIPGRGSAADDGSAAQAAQTALAQQVAEAPAGSIYFEVPKFGVASVGAPAAVNGSKITWLAAPISITTQQGFLIATRGLPEDLLAVEVSGFGAALSSGGQYQREMEWLGDREEVKRTAFLCQITVQPNQSTTVKGTPITATLYQDTCVGGGVQYTNEYWIDSGRALRRTRQWVSESAGYMETEHF